LKHNLFDITSFRFSSGILNWSKALFILPNCIGVGPETSPPSAVSYGRRVLLLQNRLSVLSTNCFIWKIDIPANFTHSFSTSNFTFGFKPQTRVTLCSSSDIDSIDLHISELKRSVHTFSLPIYRSVPRTLVSYSCDVGLSSGLGS
jgi:hypothetical protein